MRFVLPSLVLFVLACGSTAEMGSARAVEPTGAVSPARDQPEGNQQNMNTNAGPQPPFTHCPRRRNAEQTSGIPRPPLTSRSERFDIAGFSGSGERTLSDGTLIHQFGGSDGYDERTRPPGSFFEVVKSFYASGHVETKGIMTASGNTRVGVWYHYAEDGSLTEAIDHDLAFDFSLDELVLCLRDQGIPVTEGWSQHPTTISTTMEPPSWWVTWELNPALNQSVQIDAATGRVIAHHRTAFQECGVE